MEVKQIYSLVNGITSEVTGKTNLVKEDLSNVVDVGTELFSAASVDNFVKKLVDRIGKTIFVNRVYSGKTPSVVMDGWEFGSVLQKISADLPNATENESWELENGTSYDPNIFYKPSVSVKFFNSKVTFEIPISFTEMQIKSAFNSASELNAFLSMIFNAVEKSLTVKIDSLVMRTINNMIAHTYNNSAESPRSVNLLKLYNEKFNKTLTAAESINDADFLRFASLEIMLYTDRIGVMSTLFNVGGKERFTSKDDLHLVLLSDFIQGAKTYLESDTFHNELIKLPTAETVPFWQGSGQNYNFSDVSTIKTTIDVNGTKTDVELSGILGVMFDRDALGVCNLDRRVTTNYNPKAEFYSNWYKFDCSYFNDLNENFVVFYVKDSEQ